MFAVCPYFFVLLLNDLANAQYNSKNDNTPNVLAFSGRPIGGYWIDCYPNTHKGYADAY